MRAGRLALIAVVIAAAALRLPVLLEHVRVDYDEGRYLDNAVHIMEGDGFATSTVSHFFGPPPRPPRPEDFSSPLYPYLLAGLFQATGASFEAAKILNVILDVAAVPLVFLLGRRLFGAGTGLAAAAALALQPDQAIVGAWAMTEPIYKLLLLAALLAAASLALPRERPVELARAVVLGLLCGLLYLARQNGMAVAASLAALVVLGPLSRDEGRVRRVALAAVMAAIAFVVCLPWFARNAADFGSPTFTRMKNVGWAEHARSLYTFGEETPSIQRFASEHGTAAVWRSIARRAQRVAGSFLMGESGPFRWLSILALLAPFLPGLRAGAALLLPSAILSAALFMGVAPWSGAIPRYLLPLRPLLYLAGAAVAGWLWRAAASRAPRGAMRGAGAAAAVGVAAWAVVSTAPVYRDYLAVDQSAVHAAAMEASAWIAAATAPGDVLLEGGLLHQYAWVFRRGVVWIPFGDLGASMEVARRYGARWLAITPEVLRFRPELAGIWRVEGRRLVAAEVPPGLTLALDQSAAGVLIYRIDGIATPAL